MNFLFSPAGRRCAAARFLALCLVFAGAWPALAATSERQAFPGSLLQAPAGSRSTAVVLPGSKVNPEEIFEFQVAMRMRDFPKLLHHLQRGEKISPAEMAARYYPLPEDCKLVSEWLRTQGLAAAEPDANGLNITVHGKIADVQKALRTTFARVNFEGAEFTAAQTVPSLPARIGQPVLAINGLQPYLRAHKFGVHPTPMVSNQPPYLVNEILKAYSANGLSYTGANQTIAILIDTTPLTTDLTKFWNDNSVSQSLSNVTTIDVLGTNKLPAPEGEETLDVEWSSGIAPASKIRVYAVTSLEFTNIDKGLQRIINDLPSQPQLSQLSISLGLGETYLQGSSEVQTESQYFATLASNNVSVFVSTGDAGSNPDSTGHSSGGPLQAEYESTDPSVTAVGGTTMHLNTSTGAVSSETGWADGGGGASIFFSRPTYQTGTGVPSGSARLVPDVALPADPNTGCYLILNGQEGQYGGTSWSAPMWAGFCARINQARVANGQTALGLLNTKIYPLIGTANFRDITSGSNGAYTAGVGYDEVTGIGVPNLAVLLPTLAGSSTGGLAISSFSPTSGAAGTTVTIDGTGFSGVTSVQFNGTTATFTIKSATELTATVPSGASSGPISVSTSNSTASSTGSFTVSTGSGNNDNFANAQKLTGVAGSVTGSNVGATKEPGEPDHAGDDGGASVWYVWTPPESGTYTFDTTGSDFDTLLAVYTGSSVSALTTVASNDDSGSGVTSSVTFTAQAGTTYHIAVDGYDDDDNGVAEMGDIDLNYQGVNLPGTLQLAAASTSVNENAGTLTVQVTRLNGSTGAVSAVCGTVGGTAGSGTDYSGLSKTLTWATGDSSAKSFTVPIIDRGISDGSTKQFSVKLSAPTGGAALGSVTTETVTIKENDSANKLAFGASAYTVNEYAGSITVHVLRSGSSSGAASVVCGTTSGTAKSGTDYTGLSQTLTWASGDTAQKAFTVPVKDLGLSDGSSRQFSLKLSNPTNASVGSPATATVTIKENDPAQGELEFAASSYSVSQTAGTVTVKVNRAVGSTGAVSVVCGTSSQSASSGRDYTGKSQTLTWAAGDKTAKSFTVSIINRGTSGGTGLTFAVKLSSPTGSAIVGTPATTTITINK